MVSLAEDLRNAVKAREALRSIRRFISQTPKYEAPEHLGPYLDLLERTRTQEVRAVIAAPPRHGKSESLLHYIVQSLLLNPTDKIAYCTYAAEFSEQQAKRAAIIAELRGLKLAEQRASFWRTSQGGEVIWTSIGGPLTGKGVHKLFVDDPVKGRAEAESAAYREAAIAWFNSVAATRIEPGGSIIVMATRWHPADLSGKLIAQGWEYINIPALSPDGRALWPARYDEASLAKIRKQIGEYDWNSLFQGEPRTKGGRVFGPVHFFVDVPEGRYRVCVGIDLAYTAKKHSDYSCAVVLAEQRGTYYVLEVVRAQTEAPKFFDTLVDIKTRYPGAHFHWHASTTERGLAEMMSSNGLPITAELASGTGDKFTRAQPVAAAWNSADALGEPEPKVLVKAGAPWVTDFATEIADFTGVNDRHDDQVDALATAYSAMHNYVPIRAPKPRAPAYRMGAGRGF